MSIAKLREKGQITIPATIRESLHLNTDSVLSINKVGEAIIITKRPILFDAVATKFSIQAKADGITLESLLKDLRNIRK